MTAGICAILVLAFYIASSAITKYTGFFVNSDDTNFEKCLKEKDITLYINSENPEILKSFKSYEYLDEVDIFNCARNNQVCIEKSIESFPSWIIDEKLIPGDISTDKLAEASGCDLLLNK